MATRRPLVNVSGGIAELPSGDETPDAIASRLRTASTVVDVSAAAAPTTGQVLTATSGTTANWQTPSGGGGGAPTGAEYVTLATNGSLTNERVLTGTANQILLTDGGAGGNVTLSTPQDIHTTAIPNFDGLLFNGINPGASPPTGGDLRLENGLIVPSDSNSRPELRMLHAPHLSAAVQPSFSERGIVMAQASAGTTALSAWGATFTAQGTATGRNVTNTDTISNMRRIGYVSAAAAGSSAGVRVSTLQVATMSAAPQAYTGGFLFRVRFAISQVQANMRWFVGVYGTAANIGNVDPSTLLNMIGFGIDAGQTTVREMRRGAGAGLYNNLGANYPATTAGVVYEATISVPPGGTQFSVRFARLDNNNLFSYNNQMSTSLPAASVIYAPNLWINNGTTAAAVAMDVAHIYLETDL